MKKSRRAIVGMAVAGLALFGIVLKTGRAIYTWNQRAEGKKEYTVVIDPGHGGVDPGKVGINDVYEKEINLSIAMLLKEILEQNDCKIIMTRTGDEGLYQEGDSNKKMADLRKRCQLIDESGADVTVSIHQNSFSQASSKGAQVFYQTTSSSGEVFAKMLQKQLISSLDENNRRVAKANSDYYMLKHTKTTMVIVECGFLSNQEEAQLLTQDTYQRRVAWAIALGTMQYLEGDRLDEDEDTACKPGGFSGRRTAGSLQDFAERRPGGISHRDCLWAGRGCSQAGGFRQNI